MTLRRSSSGLWALLALTALFSCPASAVAQTFNVDFSRWAGPPLLKDKFGVYQTPFWFKAHSPASFNMTPLLKEAGVQTLRYEMGWGKPDTYAFDQISGAAAHPTIDFSRLDPFVVQMAQAGVAPLFAMTYDPLPLKTGNDWQRWKDVPDDLAAWGQINRRYAAHYRRVPGLPAPAYEIWNEPDLPGDGGKVFFNGSPADYGRLYGPAARGIRTGDPDASVGGPAIAYNLEYVPPVLAGPCDFLSIHAYNNASGQVANMEGQAVGRPRLPIFLTEYASFKSFGLTKPNSRHQAAERFFRDADALLSVPDLTRVYWAQWIDDDLGMLTSDLHRKALFNAYKIYQTMMPVDRNAVTPNGAGGVNVMASSDSHNAAVVVWNENTADRAVTVHLNKLRFAHGTVRLYRIDAAHASFIDDPASEKLAVDAQWRVDVRATAWTGTVPAESVVFLEASDGSGRSLLRPVHLGTYVRTDYWFPNRKADSYADFDPLTAIIRVGMGSRAVGVAQVGVVLKNPAPVWAVQVRRSGPFHAQDVNGLFGLRLDYGSTRGGYRKSVLWQDGSYHPARTAVLPWGKGGAAVDQQHVQKQLRTGGVFHINVAASAPPDWNGRLLLTPILQDMGVGSQARILLTPIFSGIAPEPKK